jgi:hypothetical protein
MLPGDVLFRVMYLGVQILAAVVLHWIVLGLALWLGRRVPFVAKRTHLAGVVLSCILGAFVLLSFGSMRPFLTAFFWAMVWAGLGWPVLRAGRRLRAPVPDLEVST